MLSKLLRYVVTVSVLLATTIAGLPLVVCVSEAHGAAIEVDRTHHCTDKTSAGHAILFRKVETSARSVPCRDYRLERDVYFDQIREIESAATIDASGSDVPYLTAADVSLPLGGINLASISPRPFASELRTSLSDLRTIVLQI